MKKVVAMIGRVPLSSQLHATAFLTLPLSFSWSGVRRVSQCVLLPLHSDGSDVTTASVFGKHATPRVTVRRGSILKPVDETVLCGLLLGLPYFLA